MFFSLQTKQLFACQWPVRRSLHFRTTLPVWRPILRKSHSTTHLGVRILIMVMVIDTCPLELNYLFLVSFNRASFIWPFPVGEKFYFSMIQSRHYTCLRKRVGRDSLGTTVGNTLACFNQKVVTSLRYLYSRTFLSPNTLTVRLLPDHQKCISHQWSHGKF